MYSHITYELLDEDGEVASSEYFNDCWNEEIDGPDIDHPLGSQLSHGWDTNFENITAECEEMLQKCLNLWPNTLPPKIKKWFNELASSFLKLFGAYLEWSNKPYITDYSRESMGNLLYSCYSYHPWLFHRLIDLDLCFYLYYSLDTQAIMPAAKIYWGMMMYSLWYKFLKGTDDLKELFKNIFVLKRGYIDKNMYNFKRYKLQ